MTIIKQTGVQSSGHMKNLRGYINDDRKVILRDSLNMDGCTNPKRWAHHMWMTREAYGHNKAARRVRDKKTGELKEAKNTILFHQILGRVHEVGQGVRGKALPEPADSVGASQRIL